MNQIRNHAPNLRSTVGSFCQILAFGFAAAVAFLLLLVHALYFFFCYTRGGIFRSTRPNQKRLHRGGPQQSRARSLHKYRVFVEYKITRRIPTLFRYHYGVWEFRLETYPGLWGSRLKTYPRVLESRLKTHAGILSSRRLFKSWALKKPRAADLRRFLLRRDDRLGCLNQYPPKPLKYDRLPVLKCCESRLAKVAIVTPSYNQAPFLEKTIRSVLDNGYPCLEYAVVDGGSQDETPLVLERYAHRLTYYVCEPDRGQSHAIQKGFAKVRGDIMAYLNSDDILLPGALRLVAAYFATHPNVDVVYGHRILIDQSGLEIGRWILPPHSNEATRRADYIPQETLFWRSEIYRRTGGIDTSFRFAMDWDLILRFQAAGVIIHRLPYFLACFRIHESQKTSCMKESIGDAEVELLRERELGKDRRAWNVQKYDEEIKHRAFITELAGKCSCRSTRL